MRKTLEARVEDAFAGDSGESVLTYIGWVRDALSEVARTVRRNVTLLFTSIALFELLLRTRGTVLTVGPVRITSTAAVVPFLPTLTGYLYLETIIGTTRYAQLRDVFARSLKLWKASAEENDLFVLVLPPMPTYWRAGTFTRDEFMSPSDRLELILVYAFAFIAVLGVIAFEGYAFWSLKAAAHVNAGLFWGNAAMSALLAVTGVTYLVLSDA